MTRKAIPASEQCVSTWAVSNWTNSWSQSPPAPCKSVGGVQGNWSLSERHGFHLCLHWFGMASGKYQTAKHVQVSKKGAPRKNPPTVWSRGGCLSNSWVAVEFRGCKAPNSLTLCKRKRHGGPVWNFRFVCRAAARCKYPDFWVNCEGGNQMNSYFWGLTCLDQFHGSNCYPFSSAKKFRLNRETF